MVNNFVVYLRRHFASFLPLFSFVLSFYLSLNVRQAGASLSGQSLGLVLGACTGTCTKNNQPAKGALL